MNTNNFVPGYLGIMVTRQVQFCCVFAATKDKFGIYLKKLFHSSTLHTYHHNFSWTIRQARNYLCSQKVLINIFTDLYFIWYIIDKCISLLLCSGKCSFTESLDVYCFSQNTQTNKPSSFRYMSSERKI